jgi:hypothetical protein
VLTRNTQASCKSQKPANASQSRISSLPSVPSIPLQPFVSPSTTTQASLTMKNLPDSTASNVSFCLIFHPVIPLPPLPHLPLSDLFLSVEQ